MLSRYSHLRMKRSGGRFTRLPHGSVPPMTRRAKKQSRGSRVLGAPFKQWSCNRIANWGRPSFLPEVSIALGSPLRRSNQNTRTSTIRRHACRMICTGNSSDAQYASPVFLAVRALQGKRTSPNAYTDGVVDYQRRRLETETED